MAQQPTQPNAIGTVTPPIAVGTGGVPPPPPAGAGAFLAFDAVDANFPSPFATAVPAFRTIHPMLDYADGDDSFAFFPSTMPDGWGGVNLSIDIYWASDEIVGDVEWKVAFERDNGPAGVNLNAPVFAAAKSVLSTAPAVTAELQVATLAFTAAEADGLTPGDPFQIAVQRAGAEVGDDLDGIAQLFRVILKGPP